MRISLKTSLILLTLISVICDTMILPFYPTFFADRFGIDNSHHVGAYIAAVCFTVMCAFPYWAKLAKRVHEVHIWVVTQLIAACLGIACFFSTDIVWFWVISLAMLVFKASYLLIYPFVLRLEDQQSHLGIVGLFSVLMHFGGIGGALLGGWVIDLTDIQTIYLIMALGDIVQVGVCLYLSKQLKLKWALHPKVSSPVLRKKIPNFIYTIGAVSLLVYFAGFLARPYFTLYWQHISGISSTFIAGLMYAIPAWMALLGLILSKSRRSFNWTSQQHILVGLGFASIGLWLQASPDWQSVIAGRILLGYAMFVITVKLEVLLFSLSQPEHYGEDFAKIHFMQNLGVIAASFLVGSLVQPNAYDTPFLVASGAMALTFFVFIGLFKVFTHSATHSQPLPQNQPTLESEKS